MIKKAEVKENQTIREIKVTNKDNSEEIIEKGMIIEFGRKNGEVNINMRFHKLEIEEINQIFAGIVNMFKEGI